MIWSEKSSGDLIGDEGKLKLQICKVLCNFLFELNIFVHFISLDFTIFRLSYWSSQLKPKNTISTKILASGSYDSLNSIYFLSGLILLRDDGNPRHGDL